MLAETMRKRGGFFVEIGALDGIKYSNTYLLEKEFGWEGILVEPNPDFHAILRKNRSAAICTDAIYSSRKKVSFLCVQRGSDLSGIAEHAYEDEHANRRQNSKVIEVNAITPSDMLRLHGAPNTIDYLSVDTEGSEFEILRAFDFDAYKVNLISVEHNFTAQEAAIDSLLGERGFQRVYRRASQWDAWYKRTVEG